ncbi:MAG: hypothetical protein IT287_03640 [Bdellovibrionaceae bacterium]|nr:hypothetical protein [Pseudobdellovibrionaceae bacterium]
MMKIIVFTIPTIIAFSLQAGVSALEESDEDSVITEAPQPPVAPKVCPPTPKEKIKIVSAVQFFEHIKENEGCRTNAPEKLTIEDVPNNQKDIIAALEVPHTILFHCGGKPTTTSNTNDEVFQVPGNMQLINGRVTENFYSLSEKKMKSQTSAYKVLTTTPRYKIKAPKNIIEFRKVRIKETGESAIEMIGSAYPLCPDGQKERALLLPMQAY